MIPCSEGNPLGGSTPFSDQESQEKHTRCRHSEKFASLGICFLMPMYYTLIGWSDD